MWADESLEKRIMEPKLEKVSSGGEDGVGLEDLPTSSSSSSSSSSASSSCSSNLGNVTSSGGEEALPVEDALPAPETPLPIPVFRPL